MKDIMPPINTPDNQFHDGNPLTGSQGTLVTAQFMNDTQSSVINVQTELKSILTGANIQINDSKNDQVLEAINKLIRSNSGASLAQTGWQKLPSGLVMQWGTGAPTNGRCDMSFPIAFSGKPFIVTFGCRDSTYPALAQSIVMEDASLTAFGFTCRVMTATNPPTNNSSAFFWFSLGYI